MKEPKEITVYFKEKFQNILKRYVTILKIKDPDELIESSGFKFYIAIKYMDSFDALKEMENEFLELGFKISLEELKQNIEIDEDQLKELKGQRESNELENKDNRKYNKISDPYEAKDYVLFILKLYPLSPWKFKLISRKKKKKERNIIPFDHERPYQEFPKHQYSAKELSYFMLSIIGVALVILLINYILLSGNKTTTSLLYSFNFNEVSAKLMNAIYLNLALIMIIITREASYYFACKFHKVPYDLPYFCNLRIFNDKKNNPNKLFDVVASRLLSGFIISTLLGIWGLYKSIQVDTSSLDINYYKLDNNFYNLLILIVRKIMFREKITNVVLNGRTLPDKVILMHPIAYAGYLGLCLTFISLIPLMITDGSRLFYACFKKFISYYEIKDVKFAFYEITPSRKKFLVVFLIIFILVFPQIFIYNYDFIGFMF
ncbi:MAG: hypothetical protein ACTSU2_14855 [Promethearchaeota archaeon]